MLITITFYRVPKGIIIMNKKYTWAIIIVVIIAIIGVYLLGTKNHTQTKGFNVGLISILSGEYAAVGENFRNGAVLAEEQYNAAHPDAPIKMTIEDDGFSGGKAVSAYQKLVNVDKIDALINVSTASIDAIYDSVTKLGIPVAQGGEQGRVPTDDNVFGIYPDSIASERDYGVYMRNKGITQMTLVYTKIDAMIRFVDAFKEGFQGKTTDIVIDSAETDFRTHALKATSGNPNAIGIFMFPQQGAQFMKEYLRLAKNKPTIFFDTNFVSGYTDYQRIMGDLTVLDGSIVGGMKLEDTQAFKDAYKARYGTDAPFLSDIGYDSFNLLVKTYSPDKATWVANMKNADFQGVSGEIKFGPTGNRLPETKMMIIQGGRMVDLK